MPAIQQSVGQDGSAVASQIIAALITGLLIAFGLQLLLTNFAVAIGFVVLKFRASLQSQTAQPTHLTSADSSSSSSDAGSTVQLNSLVPSIGVLAGLGIMITINLVLFAACFLATRFSQVDDLLSGIVVGISIWAAYFLILLKLSTAATASVITKLLGFSITGIGGLMSLIRQALKQPTLDAKSLSALRQQIQVKLDASELQETFDAYITKLTAPELEWQRIRVDLETLLQQSHLEAAIDQPFNRDSIIKLLKQRSQVTDIEIDQVVNQLETIWQKQQQTSAINKPILNQIRAKAVAAKNIATKSITESKIELEPNPQAEIESGEKDETEYEAESPLHQIYHQLHSYLRYTNIKKLTPKRIERKLKKLLDSVPLDIPLPLDQTILETILQSRKNLSLKQRHQIIQQIQQIWSGTLVAAGAKMTQAAQTILTEPETTSEDDQSALDDLIDKIVTYLNSAFELPHITQQLKHSLTEWFARFQSELPSWQTLWQQSGVEQLAAGQLSQLWQTHLQKLAKEVTNDLQLHNLSEATQSAIQAQIVRLQQQLSQPIEAAQQAIQAQIDELTQQAQQRLEGLRQSAATAAWWLFTIALTAILSSATAAGLAANSY